VVVPFVGALIPLFMLENAGPVGLFGIPSVVVGSICGAVVIAGFIFSFKNWRCPACKCYLGKRYQSPILSEMRSCLAGIDGNVPRKATVPGICIYIAI